MRNGIHRKAGGGARTGLAALAAGVLLAGCDALLDVSNPNQLVQEDLESPAAAEALANGARSTVARAFSYMMLRHDAASDELQFVGSRDAYLQLSRGDIRDPANEFTDSAWPFISEARWMADEAIRQLRVFREDDLLADPILLARAKLYSAMIYTQIADLWEDFTMGDRMEEGPPVGPENMEQMYEDALENLDLALAIAQEEGDGDLETVILAQRARTQHARGVWEVINPPGDVPADPLVHDEGAVADAEAALARAGSDWRFQFSYSAGTVTNNWGIWVVERQELRPSDAYVEPTESNLAVEEVILEDPIDEVPDPALTDRIDEITGNQEFAPITVLSARELHLILAEAALAQEDETGFEEHINDLRALDVIEVEDPEEDEEEERELTPYDGQVDAIELLEHSRRAQLFNQGRRLSDHYRFGSPSFLWSETHEAFTRPGTKFPITQIELDSNCYLLGTC